MNRKRILLISPSKNEFYQDINVGKVGAVYSPNLNVAVIAGAFVEAGADVMILDLSLYNAPLKMVREKVREYQPVACGISILTPDFYQVKKIVQIIRETYQTQIFCGGVHATLFPEQCVSELDVDFTFVGEADLTVKKWFSGDSFPDIPGFAYRDESGRINVNKRGKYIKDLDLTPFPAHHLYNLENYRSNEVLTRKNPAGWLETSRGCVFDCGYCNKDVHGRTFRTKSKDRILEEIKLMITSGYKEIHISDDGFTTDMNRSAEICEGIINAPLQFPWSCVNGIRVDRVNQELLNLMARAGCYRISFGIESGNQRVLNEFGKKVSLSQIENAIRMAKKAGMEIFGYFMLALPTDDESSMKDTLNFAKSLDLDLAKVSVTIPFPGTPFYQYYKESGLIKTENWSLYNVYRIPRDIYDHKNLSWDIVEKYYKRFYRTFYWRPSFIKKRLHKSLSNGHFLQDLKTFISVRWV